MSVIIRLQNLPWSANAMDIRNFFRGLSIPEGGVHIVGGEQGDAFIAFSTDEDARQAMMIDGGKIKEVQVKLLLSSRSEMHKVIETARQSVPVLQMSQPVVPIQPQILPQAIPGLIAQNVKIPTNIPPPFPIIQQPEPVTAQSDIVITDTDNKRGRDSKPYRSNNRSRSRSRDADKKDRGRDKKGRDRSRSRDRSRDRRRRDRSRSRDRRDRKRDRSNRSRDRDRSKDRNDRFQRDDKKIDLTEDNTNNKSQFPPYGNRNNINSKDGLLGDYPFNKNRMDISNGPMVMGMPNTRMPNTRMPNTGMPNTGMPNIGMPPMGGAFPRMQIWKSEMQPTMTNLPVQSKLSTNNVRMDTAPPQRQSRFSDNPNMEQIQRLQELVERRNPNAFQTLDNIGPGVQLPFHNERMPIQNFPMQNDPRARFNQNTQGLCVKVQNLLTSIGYGDIRRFFSGNFISNQGLKIINNDNGKRSGVALVKFFRNDGKQSALRKNGELLKGKPVYVTHLDEQEFEMAVDSYRPNRESDESDEESQKNLVIAENNDSDDRIESFKVLYLEDLPGFAKEHDIMKMFSDYSLLSIIIVMTKDTRKQYCAYVQFVNADDAKAALNNKSKHLIGHKMIKVSPCSEAAFEAAKANQNNADHTESDEPEPEPEPDIPDEEYREENIEPTPPSRDPRQRRFEPRSDDAGFNKTILPPLNIMNPRMQWRGNSSGPINNMNHSMRPMHNDFKQPVLDCLFMKGLPHRTIDRDILDFFSDVGVIPKKTHLMLNLQGQPSGDCFCEFVNATEAGTAATKDRSVLGNSLITVELVTKQIVDEARGIIPPHDKGFIRGNFRGRGFPMRGGMRRMRGGPGPFNNGGRWGATRFMGPPDCMNTDGVDSFGKPGCVLSLENVPFRAGIDEILEFFGDYNLMQTDVIRRFNENGHPTGDVRVCLHSPSEAQRALQQLNNRSIRDRKIIISMM